MKYCKICLQPDTRPNTYFSDNQICPACNYFFLLKNVDWEERYEILHDLITKNPKRHGQYFDCIIGVSGGKDSTRQAIWLRDKLKLKPLLVAQSYPPEQITEVGVANISNLIELGFDVVINAPAPQTWRKLCKEAFLKFSNWCKATELALFACVPQMAIKYQIPIILWGENPGLQLGDLKTLGKNGYDGNNLRNMNTLGGGDLSWQLEIIKEKKYLIPFQYPSIKEFEDHKIQIIYLGWFLGDWSLIKNAMYSTSVGLDIRSDTVSETGDYWGVTSLDEDWVTLNQLIKYYKYGFGRVTDYMNEAIRNKQISREKAIQIVERFDDSCSDKYIKSFCEYINISEKKFWHIVTNNLNKNLFNIENKKIIKKFKVGYGL